jgi:hypothetical protein
MAWATYRERSRAGTACERRSTTSSDNVKSLSGMPYRHITIQAGQVGNQRETLATGGAFLRSFSDK